MDWSRVQAFLAVAEHGSVAGAARALGHSQPTLGRHIRDFEGALGIEVFQRHRRGFSLTQAGTRLLPAARQMQAAMAEIARNAEAEAAQASGTVRLAASVHIAHHVLPRIIAALRAEAPEIDVVIHASDDSDNLLFREADIALRMYRPTQLDLIARHIADVPIGAFASLDYVRRRGQPGGLEDFKRHDLVGYDRSPLIRQELEKLGLSEEDLNFPVRCDNQTAYWELVCAGCGIGFTQVETGRREPRVTELPLPVDLPSLPIWLTAHETVRRIPRVARVWDHLAPSLAADFARY